MKQKIRKPTPRLADGKEHWTIVHSNGNEFIEIDGIRYRNKNLTNARICDTINSSVEIPQTIRE